MRRTVRGLTLTGVQEFRDRHGKLRRYLRRRGHKAVPLPADVPMDDPAFLAAYAAARADEPPKGEPGTLAALIIAASKGDRFKALSRVYAATLRRHWDAIRQDYGKALARSVKPHHVEADLSRADNPTDRFKAWRFLGIEAKRLRLADDFTAGLTAPERRQTIGHPAWTADEVDRYRARWPLGTVPRAAMELLAWTGARIGDAVKLGPGMVRDGVLAFRQSKTEKRSATGAMAYVPWTSPLPAYCAHMAVDRQMMHEALAACAGHMTFLATAQGRTRSEKALGTLIRESARAAGVEKSAHGLRKYRATVLAEAGATTHQIGSWTGHESLKEVEHYTKAADRRRANVGAEQEQNVVKPAEAMCQTGRKAE